MVRPTEQNAYNELQAYTLSHGDPAFIHQHIVDAWIAQHADGRTKAIGLVFALVGLYLHLQRGFTGSQVHKAHILLARHQGGWPAFPLPYDRGSVTAADVMKHPAGPRRDRAIDTWCASVWAAYLDSHTVVARLLANQAVTR
jgi:hypothetical protein